MKPVAILRSIIVPHQYFVWIPSQTIQICVICCKSTTSGLFLLCLVLLVCWTECWVVHQFWVLVCFLRCWFPWTFIPSRVGSLNLSFSIFGAWPVFRWIKKSLPIDVEAVGWKSQNISAKFWVAEWILADGGISFGMQIFRFDEGDVPGITRNCFILGLVGILAVEVSIGWFVHGVILPSSELERVDGSGSIVLVSFRVEVVAGGDLEEGTFLFAHKGNWWWKINEIMNILWVIIKCYFYQIHLQKF